MVEARRKRARQEGSRRSAAEPPRTASRGQQTLVKEWSVFAQTHASYMKYRTIYEELCAANG